MAVPIRKTTTDNVIKPYIRLVDGEKRARYNKDGTIDKRHSNAVKGKSSEVYPFSTQEEIKAMVDVFNEKIMNAPDEDKRWIASRNKMLFLIGINSSLRISDLVSLKWNFFLKEDMTFKDFCKLQPKKTKKYGKFVPVYFNDAVKNVITNYIEQYPIIDMDGYVFKSREGLGAITERAAWKIIVDTAAKAGIEHNVGTHSLRKTFGFWVYHKAKDKNNALVILQAIYNHSSPATTSRYIGLTNEEIESVFNDLNLGIDLI